MVRAASGDVCSAERDRGAVWRGIATRGGVNHEVEWQNGVGEAGQRSGAGVQSWASPQREAGRYCGADFDHGEGRNKTAETGVAYRTLSCCTQPLDSL